MPEHYTVSDGGLVLFLWPTEEGGYTVTSPLDPALITEADTLEAAFVMAHDAWELIQQYRAECQHHGGANRWSKRTDTSIEGRPEAGLVMKSFEEND